MTLTAQAEEQVARVQEAVRSSARLRPVGGGTKPALSKGGTLELSELSGVLEYTPQEYTFTALAGTSLNEVNALLAEENQYLPFDPPLAARGATLGGTVAAGLSGPGSFRFGGVRDFLLGVRFVSGAGQLVTGGGKVVKNAAGFDFPKLMVGSVGRFGALLELTFKVFPLPEAYATLELTLSDTGEAVAVMGHLAGSPFELACLDFLPPNHLLLRAGGWAEALPGRLERIQAFIGQAGETLMGDGDASLWEEAGAFSWLPDTHSLVKIPLTPSKVSAVEETLAGLAPAPLRRYSVGGNVLWLGWPEEREPEGLETLLNAHDLSALVLTGEWPTPLLGKQKGQVFMDRLTSVLDPQGKFALATSEVSRAT